MNKDNALFAVIGILLGFISGYLLHEVMAARQPPRLRPGDAAAMAAAAPDAAGIAGMPAGGGEEGAPGAGPAGGAPGAAPGAPGGGAPMMAAIQQLKEQIAKNPNDADAVLKLANANFDIRRWEQARDLYSQYLKLRPDQPDIFSDLGITLREMGQFDQALEQFAKAQKLAPGHWQSRYNQAVVLGIDLKKYDEAQKVLAELDKLQPGNQEVAKLSAEITRRRNTAS